MMSFLFSFAGDLMLDLFNNQLFEIVPLTFLFVIGLALFNMIKKVA